MSRLPTPPDVKPEDYESAARARANTVSELIGQLDGVDALASALGLAAADIVDHIYAACENDARGTNVVPHLLTSLDALADDLRTIVRLLP